MSLRLHPRTRALLATIAAHTAQAKELRRAQALLWLDQGESLASVAQRLYVTRQTVVNWVHNFQERQALPVRERLADGPRSGRPRRARGGSSRCSVPVLAKIRGRWAIARPFGRPRCSRSICGRLRRSGSHRRACASPWPAWRSGGNARAIGWPTAPRPGARQKGAQAGLRARPRTVLLMLDETIITEMPPLAYGYGRRGEQVAVPVPGTHARRVLHGALNVQSGDVLLFITETWDHTTHQAFLRMIRAHWRGWQIVLFEDRGAPHTATASRRLAKTLHIALRFLPTGNPRVKRDGPSLALCEGPSPRQSAGHLDWRLLTRHVRRSSP